MGQLCPGKEVNKLNNRIEKQVDDLVGALTDPVIVFDPGWEVPERLFGGIKLQRLVQLMKGEEGLATDAEALAYVSNASLCAPLASEWVEVYMYLFTQVMGGQGTEIPGDLRKEEISDYHKGLLLNLKQWLWQQRTKARTDRRKTARAKAKAEAEAKAPKQLALFGR